MSTIYICDCLKEYSSPGLVRSCIKMHRTSHIKNTTHNLSDIPPERFKTVGDLKSVLKGLSDDMPIELWVDYGDNTHNQVQESIGWGLASELLFYIDYSKIKEFADCKLQTP